MGFFAIDACPKSHPCQKARAAERKGGMDTVAFVNQTCRFEGRAQACARTTSQVKRAVDMP